MGLDHFYAWLDAMAAIRERAEESWTPGASWSPSDPGRSDANMLWADLMAGPEDFPAPTPERQASA